MSLSLHALPADESADPSEEFVRLLTQHQRVLLAFILGLVPARNDAEEIRPRHNQPQTRMATVGDPSRTIYCAYGRYLFDKIHGQEYRDVPINGAPR